jgi:hypothetical protein
MCWDRRVKRGREREGGRREGGGRSREGKNMMYHMIIHRDYGLSFVRDLFLLEQPQV